MTLGGIFISHSCQDRRTGPASQSREDLERWERLVYARKVRDGILKRLAGQRILHDKDLQPGDDWRAELHGWLGTCTGAVILLDEDSASSDWVRKEATILSWRSQLGSRLLLVPVFLGTFSTADLTAAGLGPLRLDTQQAARLKTTSRTDADAEALVDVVAQRLATLPDAGDDTPMGRWAAEVSALLRDADAFYLAKAAHELGVNERELGQFTDRELTLAHHLLHVPVQRGLRALEALRWGVTDTRFRRLVDLVAPGWVSEYAAQHLQQIIRLEERGIPLLTARDPDTGTDFLQRAFCCQLSASAILGIPDALGEDPELAVNRVERALEARTGASPAELERNPGLVDQYVAWELDRLGGTPLLALAGVDSLRDDVLEQVAGRFDGVRLVILGGEIGESAADACGTTLVRPPMSAREAAHAVFARTETRRLVAA